MKFDFFGKVELNFFIAARQKLNFVEKVELLHCSGFQKFNFSEEVELLLCHAQFLRVCYTG